MHTSRFGHLVAQQGPTVRISDLQGVFPPDLAVCNLEPLNNSRWLTRGNRTLRLYVAAENPSAELRHLATSIQRVYAPTWFQIKLNSSIVDGPKKCAVLHPIFKVPAL